MLSIDRPPDFITSERHTFLDHKQADWNGFKDFTNHSFYELLIASDVWISKKEFRGITNTAAERFVTAGRIPELRSNFPADAAEIEDMGYPDHNDLGIGELNTKIDRNVAV